MADPEIIFRGLSHAEKAAWQGIVSYAININWNNLDVDAAAQRVANHSGKSQHTIRHKLKAIIFLLSEGVDEQTIRNLGESEALKKFEEMKRKRRPERKNKVLAQIPASLKQAIEGQVQRVGSLIGSRDRETCWEKICSILTNLSDEEIRA